MGCQRKSKSFFQVCRMVREEEKDDFDFLSILSLANQSKNELTGVKTGGRIFLGKDSDFPVFTEGLAILEKPIAEAVELDGHVDSIDKTFSLFQLSSTMNIQGK